MIDVGWEWFGLSGDAALSVKARGRRRRKRRRGERERRRQREGDDVGEEGQQNDLSACGPYNNERRSVSQP